MNDNNTIDNNNLDKINQIQQKLKLRFEPTNENHELKKREKQNDSSDFLFTDFETGDWGGDWE